MSTAKSPRGPADEMMSSSVLVATLALVVLEVQTTSNSSRTLFQPTEKTRKEAPGNDQAQASFYPLNYTSKLFQIPDNLHPIDLLPGKRRKYRTVQEHFPKQVSNFKEDTGEDNIEINWFYKSDEDSTLDYYEDAPILLGRKQHNLERPWGDHDVVGKVHSNSLIETLFGLADLLSDFGVFSQCPASHHVFQYFLLRNFDQLIWSTHATKVEVYQKRILKWEDANHPVRTLFNLLMSSEREALCAQTDESSQYIKTKIGTLLQGLDITLQEFMEVNIKSLLRFFHSGEISNVEKIEASVTFLCRISFKLEIRENRLCVKDLKNFFSSSFPIVVDKMPEQHKAKRQKRFLFFDDGKPKPIYEPEVSVARSDYEDDSSYSSSYVVVTGGGDDVDKYLYDSSVFSVGTMALLLLLCLKAFVYSHHGPPGEKGDGGLKGVKGYTGPTGHPGYHGDPGTKGNKGEQGSSGAPGGSGDAGTKGYKGDKGHPGIPGLPGEVGDLGITGDLGPTGDDGPRGYQGERGDRGPPGRPAIFSTGTKKRSLGKEPLVHNSFVISSTSGNPEILNYKQTSVNGTANGRDETILHGKLFNLDEEGKEKIAIFSIPRMVVGPDIKREFDKIYRAAHNDTTILASYENITHTINHNPNHDLHTHTHNHNQTDHYHHDQTRQQRTDWGERINKASSNPYSTHELSLPRGNKSGPMQKFVKSDTIDELAIRPERKRRFAEASRSLSAPPNGPPYPPSDRHGAWELPISPSKVAILEADDRDHVTKDTPVTRTFALEDNRYRHARPGEETFVVTAINRLWREHNSKDGCNNCALFAFLDRQPFMDLDSYIIAGFSHLLGASESLQLLDDVREGKKRGIKMRCRRRKNTCDLWNA